MSLLRSYIGNRYTEKIGRNITRESVALRRGSTRPPGVRQIAVARRERVAALGIAVAVFERAFVDVRGRGRLIPRVELVHAHARSTTRVESGTGSPFWSKTIVPPPESVPVAPR